MAGPLLSINRFPGDGSTTIWNINFAGGYISKDHVKGYIQDSTTLAVLQTLTFAPGDWIGPNQIQVVPAVASTEILTIYRDTPKDQPLVDFTDGAIFTEANLDKVLNQAVFVAAEATDAIGTGAEDASDAATAAAASAAAAAASEAASAASAAASAGSAVASAASADFAAESETQAELHMYDAEGFRNEAENFKNTASAHASSALTFRNTAEVFKDQAGASATAAAGSATAAAGSAAAADASADAADVSEAAAAASAAAALVSENNTAAIYDSFDDRYLGAKAADPTLDNDGAALITGALYFNSTSGILKVWGGASWIPLPATVAAGIVNTPAGSIAATNVQDAINELNGNLHGVVTKTLTNANVTLTAAEANNRMIFLSGALTANVTLYLPATVGEWMVNNGCTGAAFTVSVRIVGNVGALHVIPNGYRKFISCYDGLNIIQSLATIAGPYFTGGVIVTDGHVQLSDNATATDEVRMGPILEMGSNRGSNGVARIDMHTTVGSDWEARIIRQTGPDGTFDIQQSGTSNINFVHGGIVHFAIAQNGAAFHRGPGWGNAGAGFFCRAWVSFNGTGTPAIVGSGNVSSITDHATGEYTINFTTAMPDTAYCWNGTARSDADTMADRAHVWQKGTTFTKSTTALRIAVSKGSASSVAFDSADISVTVFR